MNDKLPTINFVIIEDEDKIYLETTVDKFFKTTSLCTDMADAEQRIKTKLLSYGGIIPKFTIEFQTLE